MNNSPAQTGGAISPRDVLLAGPWSEALFTTFSLSLAFFEAIPLHALRQANCRSVTIFADLVGYQASIGEAGLRDVGRRYNLIPVAVSGGLFHPKIAILLGQAGPRVMVGSGNLTFGGWGHNLELLDYLAPAAAPEAFGDLATFLDAFQTSSKITPGQVVDLDSFIKSCRDAAIRAGDGRTRFLHSLTRPIALQLSEYATELGGARSLVVVSPYFGGVEAVRSFAALLSCEAVSVCAPERAPEFFPFEAADRLRFKATSVRAPQFEDFQRSLHAKLFSISCRRGNLTFSGSVNATQPSLITGAHVEAGILRIQRRSAFTWSGVPRPPNFRAENSPLEAWSGCVLVARLAGSRLTGRILRGKNVAGEWTGTIIAGVNNDLEPLPFSVNADGQFESSISIDIDLFAIEGSLLLELRRGLEKVRGWVILQDTLTLIRERGPIAESILRTLAGNDDPLDLRAILEYFAQNPTALLVEPATSGGSPRPDVTSAGADGLIRISDLSPVEPSTGPDGDDPPSKDAAAFERLIAALRRHLRMPMPASVAQENDEGDEGQQPQRPGEITAGFNKKAVPRYAFESVAETILASIDERGRDTPGHRDNLLLVLDLGLYVAARSIDPSSEKAWTVEFWLNLVRGRVKAQVPVADALDRAVVIILVSRVVADPSEARLVHGQLQKYVGGAISQQWAETVAPGGDPRERIIAPDVHVHAWQEAWRLIIRTLTPWDEAKAIYEAITRRTVFPASASILNEPEGEIIWNVIQHKESPDQVLAVLSAFPACPRCHISLPKIQADRLFSRHVATAVNCCHRVLLNLIP